MENREIIKKLKGKIKKFNEGKDQEETAKLIMKLLKWEFSLKIENFVQTDKHSEIFKFLSEKKRTARIYEASICLPGVEAPKMDKDFFIKYHKKLFPLLSENIEFKDEKITIFISHDGDLWIEEK